LRDLAGWTLHHLGRHSLLNKLVRSLAS
ncbi:MAG: hypothetical protein ACJAUR_002016, partial [Ulvibacter sp.]